MNAPVRLDVVRAERALKALQQSVRQEFGALLGATFDIWMETHRHTAMARDRSAVHIALNHCRYNLPLKEAQLKAVRDTLQKWLKEEQHPGVKRGLECCLELITKNGKHLMGYGKVQPLRR